MDLKYETITLCLDDSNRVKLTGSEESDYINASHIKVIYSCCVLY